MSGADGASGVLDRLRVPIVQAPLSGGPSTPDLAVAAGRAGALGFLAAGYRSPEDLRADIRRVRACCPEPSVFAALGAGGQCGCGRVAVNDGSGNDQREAHAA